MGDMHCSQSLLKRMGSHGFKIHRYSGQFLMFLLFFTVFLYAVKGYTQAGYNSWQNFPAVWTLSDSLAIAREMRQQGLTCISEMEFGKAENLLRQAQGIAQRLGNRKATAVIGNNLAECYSVTGRHVLAVETYSEAYEILAAISDTAAMAGILINLGDEYAKTGQLEKAAEAELRAIRLKEAARDSSKLAFFYQKLGELFSSQDIDMWAQYAQKALQLSRKPEHTTWYTTIAIYNDLGAIYKKRGDYILAGAYYDTMYHLSAGAGYKKGISTANSENASLLYIQGKYKEAYPYAVRAYEMIATTNDHYYLIYGATLKAKILLKLGNPAQAMDLLEPAYRMARESLLLNEEMEAGKYLYESAKALGKWKEALQFFEHYSALKDSLEGIEIRRTLNDMQIRFETGKKQQIIERLSDKNLAQARQNRMLAGLLLTALAGVFLLILLLRLRTRTLEQNRELQRQRESIHQLESQRLQSELAFKSRELSAATLHLISKNKALAGLREKLMKSGTQAEDVSAVIRQINQNINLDRDWQNFSLHFEEVHPDFFRRLRAHYPDLTSNEEKLCAYLRINLSTKEISQMLNLTVAAVDKARNRLRKKLGLKPEQSLTEFMAEV